MKKDEADILFILKKKQKKRISASSFDKTKSTFFGYIEKYITRI